MARSYPWNIELYLAAKEKLNTNTYAQAHPDPDPPLKNNGTLPKRWLIAHVCPLNFIRWKRQQKAWFQM